LRGQEQNREFGLGLTDADDPGEFFFAFSPADDGVIPLCGNTFQSYVNLCCAGGKRIASSSYSYPRLV